MKKTLLIVLLSLFNILACNQRPVGRLSQNGAISALLISQEQVRSSMRATVGLVSRQSTEEHTYFSCTGVIISEEYILTAEHCVDNDIRQFLGPTIPGPSPIGDVHQVVSYEMFRRNDFSESLLYEVVAADDERDLALLRAINELFDFDETEIASLGDENVFVGQYTYAIGHPAGIPFNLSHGFVSSLTSGLRIYTSTQIYRGNSGGPLFDDRGRIIGIASIIVYGQPYLNGSVHIRTIRDFIQDSGIEEYLR